jgi:peroxiredoxin
LQANLARFEELNAQVLGISVDSVHAHRVFAEQLGITFPLLADFHPKGAVAQAYGLWRDEWGTSKRAVIIIDGKGIVRYSEVIPKGPPDVEEIIDAVKAVA